MFDAGLNMRKCLTPGPRKKVFDGWSQEKCLTGPAWGVSSWRRPPRRPRGRLSCGSTSGGARLAFFFQPGRAAAYRRGRGMYKLPLT